MFFTNTTNEDEKLLDRLQLTTSKILSKVIYTDKV